MTLFLPACVGACVTAAVLLHGPLLRRAFGRALSRLRRAATPPGRSLAEVFEAVRLRLAAALLDLGNYLMLSAEERRAFRLRKTLSSARAPPRGRGRRHRGGSEEARRSHPGDPDRRAGPGGQPEAHARPLLLRLRYARPRRGRATGGLPFLFWRVANRHSPGHRGPSVALDVPDLQRALISYHARPLRLAGGATGTRFFDEGTHDEPAQ